MPVLVRHGGHANKFVGDGLLGVFGAPERLPDHADRAVAAAIEIARLVDDAYGDELRIGIGVNSGPVLAGTIGGGGRLEFTVIGDAVNTASRVEQVTRETGDTVLITEATLLPAPAGPGGFWSAPRSSCAASASRSGCSPPPSWRPPREAAAPAADTLAAMSTETEQATRCTAGAWSRGG